MRLHRNVHQPVRVRPRVVAAGVVLGALALLAIMAAPRDLFDGESTHEDMAKIQLDKLRTTSSHWVKAHPGRCPRMPDFDPEATDEDRMDPWGHLVMIACDVDGRVITRSNGADGRSGTDDDLVSQ